MKQGTMNILFFILKTKLLKNGEAPILMWITIDGQYEETRIQRSISPKLWDSSKGCGKGKDRATKGTEQLHCGTERIGFAEAQGTHA